MDNFYIGQKFEGEYPPEAAIWCNNNGAMISQVESWLEIQSIPSPTLEDQLAALKSSYDTKLAALDISLQNALWADGTQEAATRAALSAKRTALIRERSAAIKALTGK